MKHHSLPFIGTALGAIFTTLMLVVLDSPRLLAQNASSEQEQTQADVAERARDLLERFTQQRDTMGEATESTKGIPQEIDTIEPEEPFDMGPVETLSESQGLDEPVEDLPDSGLGIPITTLALGLTVARHRKKLSRFFQKKT
jgi:hypothetical protein